MQCNAQERVSTFDGHFLDGAPHGAGVFTWPLHGRKVQQLYHQGRLVCETPLPEEAEAKLTVRERMTDWEAQKQRDKQAFDAALARARAEFDEQLAADKVQRAAEIAAHHQTLQDQTQAAAAAMAAERAELHNEVQLTRQELAAERAQVEADLGAARARDEADLAAARDRLAADQQQFAAEQERMAQYKDQVSGWISLNVGGLVA